MFEKEAEEYATTGYEKKLLTKEQITVLKCGRYDGFKKGAEFGYNKANEWHYVKDGDLPKENQVGQVMCLLLEHNHSDLITYLGDDFSKWEGLIAWKEIVLSELPKGNE